jgi:hypothetical protein
MAPSRAPWLVLLSAALTGACGSDPVREPEPGDEQPLPVTCDDGPNYATDLTPEDVGTVSATLLADGVTPAADVLVTVCGVDVCSRPAHSDADGEVSVTFDTPVSKPAFKYGDGLVYGEFALPLEDAAEGLELGELFLPRLPETGSPIAAGRRSESGGVAIELQDNATTDVDELLPPYDSEETSRFRATEVSIDDLPPGLDSGHGLELVFALAPLGATLCPAARLEVPNSAGWAAGTEVEFLLEGFGVTDLQFWAPYADWAVFATGEVDASGERIVTTSEGLPLISNVGVRRR